MKFFTCHLQIRLNERIKSIYYCTPVFYCLGIRNVLKVNTDYYNIAIIMKLKAAYNFLAMKNISLKSIYQQIPIFTC